MVSIYTLTLSPSLDSATLTPQIYPEGKLRCSAPVFEPGGGDQRGTRHHPSRWESHGDIPCRRSHRRTSCSLLADEQVAVETVEAKDWTRQNLHVHVESSGEQYRFVMPRQTERRRVPSA